MLRRFVRSQVNLCKEFDNRFFGHLSVDGNRAFVELVRSSVGEGVTIAEIGGGKTPLYSAAEVRQKSLRVTGVDLDADELVAAELGCYEQTIVSRIEDVCGDADHDIVIAQSVFEHVLSGADALRGAASILKQGGRLYSFCPSRRAWFARLNLVLPEKMKRVLLFGLFPEKRERQGFPAHYNGCTPEEFKRNLTAAGFRVEEFRSFFVSSYFMFFFPLYIFWRLTTFPLMKWLPSRYCETFIIVAVKN